MSIETFGCFASYHLTNAFGITSSAPPRKTNIVTFTFARRTRRAAATGRAPSVNAAAAVPPAAISSRRVSARSAVGTWSSDTARCSFRVEVAIGRSLPQHRGVAYVPAELHPVADAKRRGAVVRSVGEHGASVVEGQPVADVGTV